MAASNSNPSPFATANFAERTITAPPRVPDVGISREAAESAGKNQECQHRGSLVRLATNVAWTGGEFLFQLPVHRAGLHVRDGAVCNGSSMFAPSAQGPQLSAQSHPIAPPPANPAQRDFPSALCPARSIDWASPLALITAVLASIPPAAAQTAREPPPVAGTIFASIAFSERPRRSISSTIRSSSRIKS